MINYAFIKFTDPLSDTPFWIRLDKIITFGDCQDITDGIPRAEIIVEGAREFYCKETGEEIMKLLENNTK